MDSKYAWAAAQDSIYYRFIGRAIRVLRAERGLERKELAARSGISYPYLSEIESGKKRASSQALLAIAEALGVRPHELLAMAEALARREEPPEAAAAPTWSPAAAAPPSSPPPSRFFHELPIAAAAPEQAEVPEPPPPPLPPGGTPPPAAGHPLEAALGELRRRLERMAAEDIERILDLARRLSR